MAQMNVRFRRYMIVPTSYKNRQKIFDKHSKNPQKIRRVSRKMSSSREDYKETESRHL